MPVVSALLAAEADVNQARDDGETPLCYAALRGHLPVVSALLEAKADVNQARDDGATPLLIAAGDGHLPVVSALLDAKADANQAAAGGVTPFIAAENSQHVAVMSVLLLAKESQSPLFMAVILGKEEAALLLMREQLQARGPSRGVLNLSRKECKQCPPLARLLIVSLLQRLEREVVEAGLNALARQDYGMSCVFPTEVFDLVYGYALCSWEDIEAAAASYVPSALSP